VQPPWGNRGPDDSWTCEGQPGVSGRLKSGRTFLSMHMVHRTPPCSLLPSSLALCPFLPSGHRDYQSSSSQPSAFLTPFYLSTCNSPCSSPPRVSLGGWFTDSLNVRVLGDGGSGYFYFFHAFFFYGCIFNMGLSPVQRQTLSLSV